MATVFWDSEGVILVDFMPKGTTINSDVYTDTLRKLKARLRRVRPHLDMSKVLLQHDNARTHTSLKICEVIASFGWTTVTHPPYSPDLAPSDYHRFEPLKEGVRGQHFTSDQEVKNAVRNWLKMQPAGFYKAGIVSLFIDGQLELKSAEITLKSRTKFSCPWAFFRCITLDFIAINMARRELGSLIFD